MQHTCQIKSHLAVRTDGLEVLLAKWKKENPGRSWAYLLRCSLKRELRAVAGKRYAHLVQ